MPPTFPQFAGQVIYLLDQLGLLLPLQFFIIFLVATAMMRQLTKSD
jgi:hypothetical protein